MPTLYPVVAARLLVSQLCGMLGFIFKFTYRAGDRSRPNEMTARPAYSYGDSGRFVKEIFSQPAVKLSPVSRTL